MDTIFALASAPGKAGVAVIRVSGSDAFDAAEKLAGFRPDGRCMKLRTVRGGDGEVLDHGLVLAFLRPASFTGENIIEFQLHGSMAVVRTVLAALHKIPGFRHAEPGEFTRRALENGKLDLTQVEGLADLIEAETAAQSKQALRVFAGAFGKRVETWRSKLIRSAALIEASIDFADEEVPEDVGPEVSELLDDVSLDLKRISDGVLASERIRSGFEVAIVGAPNIGKSTLLNLLAGRDAALTSEIAGTTRDVIEVRMDLGGLPVTLLDTAGVRETDDEIEGLGILRAKERADAADLRVFLVEPGQAPALSPREEDLVLVGKGDLHPEIQDSVSGVTGSGVDELVKAVTHVLSDKASGAGLATRQRHHFAMVAALASIEVSQEVLSFGPEKYDIAADEIRHAITVLESIVGRVDVENLLDEIFSSFCIGK